MKKVGILIFSLLVSCFAFGQHSPGVSAIPAGTDEDPIDPVDTLHIIVDLEKIDVAEQPAQDLVVAAQNGEDMYIWTWSPVEHPAGHPLANGIGGEAWKNSNEALKMEKVDSLGSLVYVYTMVPTVFYGVDAKEVYDNDIAFLVKPKDGGGYGAPDIKSNDLNLVVDPPPPPKIFNIPSVFFADGYMSINYDNNIEQRPTMRNLHPDSVVLILYYVTDLDSGYSWCLCC